jgi:hypothetical protein
VRALERRNDAFRRAEGLEGVERGLVGNAGVLDAFEVSKVSVLGPDRGIVGPAETECVGRT